MALDDTQILSVLAIAVPVIVVLAIGYVKRGRQSAVQGEKIDRLVGLAEEGRRVHEEMRAEIGALKTKVAVLEALVRKNGHAAPP